MTSNGLRNWQNRLSPAKEGERLGKAMSREVTIVGRIGVIKTPRRKTMQPLSESALQIAVVEHLRLTGVPGLLFFSIPNEGQRTPANGARMKAMGMLPGVADLFVKHSRDEWPLFLELKKRGEKPRQEQEEFGRLARYNSCYWSWTDNLDGALQILRDYGAIRSK